MQWERRVDIFPKRRARFWLGHLGVLALFGIANSLLGYRYILADWTGAGSEWRLVLPSLVTLVHLYILSEAAATHFYYFVRGSAALDASWVKDPIN